MTKPYVAVKPEWLSEEDGDKETLYAVSDLTRRQLQVVIALLGLSGIDDSEATGYRIYDAIFESAQEVAGFKHGELSPFTVFNLPQAPGQAALVAEIEAYQEGSYGGTAS